MILHRFFAVAIFPRKSIKANITMKKILILAMSILILTTQTVFSQSDLENNYDISQYILDLNISNSSTVISGNVIINAKVVATSLDTIVFELITTIIPNYTFMVVDSVLVNGVVNQFQHTDDLVFIPLADPMASGQLFSVKIWYHGNGHYCNQMFGDGIAVRTFAGNMHSFNLNELYGPKMWFPCKQVLTDKADSVTFYITTDSTNKTGSNGLLVSKTNSGNGKCRYKWVTHYPIAYYLISFVVGPYEENTHYTHLQGSGDSVLMQNLLIHDNVYYPIHLKAILQDDILLNLYSEKFGTYPFKNEKYGNSVIGIGWAGMEHQTMCTMGYQVLDTTMTDLGFIYSWGNAHELAHHWFGDFVTCGRWNDIWLNEGFGTYVEYLAIQNLETQARADIWRDSIMSYVKSAPDGSVYIPDSLMGPYRIFDPRLTYCKGGAVIHILRYEINNDSVFYLALRNYLAGHAYGTATTEDFKHSIETTAGTDLSDFFNQWVYGEGYPVFDIMWYQYNDTLVIQSVQTASTSATPLFKTHFDIGVKTPVRDTLIRLYQSSSNQTYKIYFPQIIDSVRFDPDKWLLQKNSIRVGIGEKVKAPCFSLIPNPAKDNISIKLKEGTRISDGHIFIYNVQGRLLITDHLHNESMEVDISGLAPGLYLLKLMNVEMTGIARFVKE
jgi:aminopeptidase N